MTAPPPPRPVRPRQRRAVETRARVFAARAEYQRVGIEQARVEDIVSAAGLSRATAPMSTA